MQLNRYKFSWLCPNCQTVGEHQYFGFEPMPLIFMHRCNADHICEIIVDAKDLKKVENFPLNHAFWRRLKINQQVSSYLTFKLFQQFCGDSCTIDKAIEQCETFTEMIDTYENIPLTDSDKYWANYHGK